MIPFDPCDHRYPSQRNTVFANRGMVCSSIPQASGIGLDILKKGGNAVDAAVAVKDTINAVRDDGTVAETRDRAALRAVQTPQIFESALLKAALQAAVEGGIPITDDCSAVERLGKRVYLVEGDEENLKITTPVDLILAEAILQAREDRI